MYHDQGQIAMKLLGFDRGVTLLGGYPFPICTPAHGTAYDIAGKGVANPVATFWTAAMMLEHLGEPVAAAALITAVEQVCAAGILTADVGGSANTAAVTAAVVAAIKGANS